MSLVRGGSAPRFKFFPFSILIFIEIYPFHISRTKISPFNASKISPISSSRDLVSRRLEAFVYVLRYF